MELGRHSYRLDKYTGYVANSARLAYWENASLFANTYFCIGVCSSLCFGRNGELFVCGGQTPWRVQLEGTIFRGS